MKTISGPPQPAIFSFIPDKDSEVKATLKTIGRVSDVKLDAVTGTLASASISALNKERVIQVNITNMEGKTVAAKNAERSQIQVEVAIPDHHDVRQSVSPSTAGDSSLIASHRPMATDQYTVSVNVDGKHLRGSPADVLVQQRDTFDPAKCHQSLVLSNNNFTVAAMPTNVYACVFGTRLYFLFFILLIF